jgi:hypothetical protein
MAVSKLLLAIKAALCGVASVSAQPFACPAAATTSCFAGIGSPYSAVNSIYAAALGGTPTLSAMSGSFVCMVYNDTCPRLVSKKEIGQINETNCPGGPTDFLTVYLPISLTDCPTYLANYGPGGPPGYPTLVTLCGTANCNSPMTPTAVVGAAQAPCSMTELTGVTSNPAGPMAGATAIMSSNPTCGGCLMKCSDALDATSCAMGCASAPASTAVVGAAQAPCSMPELTGVTSNPAGPMAGVMAIMSSNPTCGGCLTKCLGAADATSCAMGCASAPANAASTDAASGSCGIDKFLMLMGTGSPGADPMKVLQDISASDPKCGGCLMSVAMAAMTDPSKMLSCASSAAAPQLRALIGGGSNPTGSGSGGAAPQVDASKACAGGSNVISLKDPSMMSAAKRGCPAPPPGIVTAKHLRAGAHTHAHTHTHKARQPTIGPTWSHHATHVNPRTYAHACSQKRKSGSCHTLCTLACGSWRW